MARYKRDEMPEGQTDWERLDAMTDEEIQANAESDPDNPPWTEEDFAQAELVVPGKGVRVPISIRLYEEVIEHYKSLGSTGYQTRINEDLLKLVREKKRQARKPAIVAERRAGVRNGEWTGGPVAPPDARWG
jgi:uncharacterized protein (DUF4415 family)